MTYATEQELTEYAAARGITLTGDPQQLLTRSQDYLDAQRLTVPDPAPDDLVRANIVGALLIDEGKNLLEPVGPRVTERTVHGVVTRRFSDSGRTSTTYPELEALIAPYRATPVGFMQIGVTR